MKKHKRILSLILALILALALVPTAAFATDVTQAIPFRYDAVMDFKCGVAAVANGKVEHVYDDAYYFAGEYAIIDKTGKEVVPFGKYLTPALTSVYGGNVVYSYLPAFSEGYAAVMGQNRMWGYIDATGKEVIPCQYNGAWEFSDGLARIDAGKSANHQYGFIDTAGREVISPGKYDYAYDFHEGLAAVELDGKYGFIDTTGQEIILLKYDSVKDFSEGLAAVSIGKYPNQKWGFIDATGKEVISCQYETAGAFQNGRAVVSGSTGRVEYGRTVYGLGVIDTQGNVVVPFGEYEQQNGEDYHEGLKAVQKDSGWGYVDLSGNAVTAFQYGEPRQLSEGMLAVDLDGKWGFLAIDGLPTEPEDEPTPKPNTVTPDKAVGSTAHAATQTVLVDGKPVEFECYALQDESGNATNYVKLRDLANVLNGSPAQFQVGWDGSVTITTGASYTPNGTEQNTPYTGDRSYQETEAVTKVNGQAVDLAVFTLNDDNGGGYTYYQLRDLGDALGFDVGWSAETGVTIDTK